MNQIPNTNKITQVSSFKLIGTLFIAIIVIYLISFVIAYSQDFYNSGTDFFTFWLAPRLLVEGKSPYNPDEWKFSHELYGAKGVANPGFLYPMPLVIVLVPLGLLPFEFAAITWIALTIISILLTCYICISIWRIKLPFTYSIPILAGIFLFRPTAVNLRLGQIDWLFLLLLAAGCYCWYKKKWFAGGIVIAFTVMKPQLGLPLLVCISLWLVFRRLWYGLIGEAISVLVMFGSAWLVDHAWLIQWLSIGKDKLASTFCCTPTFWGVASLLCGFNLECGSKLGIFLAIIMFVILLLFMRKISSDNSLFLIGLSIPIALLLSPYLWTYSQVVLLIPILFSFGLMKRYNWPYMIVAPFIIYLALYSSVIVFLSIKIGVDVFSSTVSLLVFIIFWVLYRVYTKQEQLLIQMNGNHKLSKAAD